ncbi:MAG: hypothetical protein IPG50_32545 [Myxococcales bacterium]|nr:hypothetical protein [Myxococcales bacterium]
MSDIPFYRTQMGHRSYEHTMPELVRQLTRLNAILERELAERTGQPTPAAPEEDHAKGQP